RHLLSNHGAAATARRSPSAAAPARPGRRRAHAPSPNSPGRPGGSGFQPGFRGQTESMSPRYRTGSTSAGTVVAVIADIMAVILILWIVMYLLDANRANALVQFVHDAANWLAGWSRDLFTFDEAWAPVVAGSGLAAVVYLFIGHAIANRLHRRLPAPPLTRTAADPALGAGRSGREAVQRRAQQSGSRP